LQPGLNRQPIAVPLPPGGALASGPGMPTPHVPRLRVTPKAVFTPQANGFVYAAFQGNPRSFAGETRAQGFDVLHISWPGPGGMFTAVVRPMGRTMPPYAEEPGSKGIRLCARISRLWMR